MVTQEQEPRCLAHAIGYLRRGWAAIPLCPHDHAGMSQAHNGVCHNPGKVPIGRWKDLQDRRLTEQALRQAWTINPHCNVGVVLGQVSLLVGIDVDGPAGNELLNELSAGDVPKTLKFYTSTSERYRLLYTLPKGHPSPKIPLTRDTQEALAIMGDGTQTVMPPSRHHAGEVYLWAEGHSPDDISPAPAPAWLLDMLAGVARAKGLTVPQGVGGKAGQVVGKGPVLTCDTAQIMEGYREHTLLMFLGQIRRHGANKTELLALANALNERCNPPLTQADLARITDSAHKWAPTEVPLATTLKKRADALVAAAPESVDLTQLDVVPIRWLWKGWLPLSMLVAFDGDGGSGKSTTLIDLAARLTRGAPLPGQMQATNPKTGVVIVNEDPLQQIQLPRLIEAGADLAYVRVMRRVVEPGGAVNPSLMFPDHLPALEALIREVDAKLVIIDPILSYYNSGDYKDSVEIRRLLVKLADVAERHACTIVLVRHFSKKSDGGKAAYRSEGGTAWTNTCRLAIQVGPHPTTPGLWVMAKPKTNITSLAGSWTYKVNPPRPGSDVCTVDWVGYSEQITAQDVVDAEASGHEDRNALDEAVLSVQTLMQENYEKTGVLIAKVRDVTEACKTLGLSARTARRAKATLGLITVNIDGQWYWQVQGLNPIPQTEQPPDAQTQEADADGVGPAPGHVPVDQTPGPEGG